MVRMQYRFRYACNIRYIPTIIGAICALLLSSLTVYADSLPGGNVADPAIRAVNVAKPGVVRIITTVKGRLTIRLLPTSEVTFPQEGNGSYSLQLSGTGTFITSQGDILTADHVINPPKDKTLDQSLYNVAAQDVANYINQNAKQGLSQVAKDDVIQQLGSGQLSSTTSYDSPNSVAYLSTNYTGPLAASDLRSLPAGVSWQIDQIKTESPPDQQDLAIVHVPMQDAPSVQLGNSSNVHEQDKLTIIGFPGNADVSQKANDFLTSSINIISVSSKKTSEMGAPLIQVGGNVENGDSGGPALDHQGNIVGIVSFRLSSPGSSSGTSFLQESNSARSMLDNLNLDTTPGRFQKLWNQAFQDYASTAPDHWQKALGGFNQLRMNYPDFKAVQPYLDYAQKQVQLDSPTPTLKDRKTVVQTHQPQNPTSSAMPTSFPVALALTIGGGVLLLSLMALLLTISIRQGKRSNQASVTGQRADAAEVAKPVGEERRDDGKSRGTAPQSLAQPTSSSFQQAASQPRAVQQTLTLKIWPCGHMNRPGAHFCGVCGEAAPMPPGSSSTSTENG